MPTNNLVIVESPAKAKTIEKFLGKDYKVMSSFGHIRDLKKKNFGVDLETFRPEYEIPADKKHIVSELRTAAKGASTVWLASDEDREGEAISWHLAEVLKLDPKTARRIVFHEITKPAILEAIEHPRTIDLHLVDAQQARRVLDRLVGFKLSPVLWRKVRPSLSAGRVQSVAVKLIVEREREIQRFSSEANYRVVADLVLPDGKRVHCHLSRTFSTQEEAEDFVEYCRTAEFHVSEVQKKPTKRSPAPPFTTSTLQQEAARRLGFPVALTMRIAQSLYESGLITYMRTDSMNLSSLCLSATGKMVEEQMGKEYHQRRTYHTSSKGAQEAHEAIRPAYMDRSEVKGSIQEQRLYQLIWRRTMACQMADAQMERTTAVVTISGREEQFMATGEVVLFEGFLKLYEDARNDEHNGDEDYHRLLPAMQEGDPMTLDTLTAQQRYTQAPARYNEATLVHKLEELGIGRPSTYAPTISTIQQREYVQRCDRAGEERECNVITLHDGQIIHSTSTESMGAEKSRLVPTDIGTVVTDFLQENFPDIMDYNFTANVEKDFDAVAEGEKEWTGLIKDFYSDFSVAVEESINQQSEHRVGERVLGTDPATGEPVSVKIGRFGPVAQIGASNEEGSKPRFASLRPEMSIDSITLEEALELFRLPRQLGTINGSPVRVASGRFGPYVQLGKQYVSIPKDEDPLTIDIMRAAALLKAANEAEKASHLKQFEEEPELEVRAGRFGPYISYKGKNYKIPKAQAQRAAELTLEECMTIVNTPAPSRKSKQ
ncbi:MAG: type I DNA topoisomerase [Bacteroidaceae bacterium]|nr:type I DNA topoisomerase [Bacteroidaceae bacterium]